MKQIQNIKEFNAIVRLEKPILLDFTASWCPPCQLLAPTLEKLAEKHKENFTIAKVDIDTNKELAATFKVRSIPALFFIKDGKVVDQLQGLQAEIVLENKIQQLLEEVEA